MNNLSSVKRLLPELPSFNLPDTYSNDEWEIENFDFYKTASKNHKNWWKKRSNITNYKLRFSLCKNEYIKEELKYIMYDFINIRKISLATFSEYYDKYKVLCRFVNKHMVNCYSLTELKDYNQYYKHLIFSENIKTKTIDGNIINGNMEKVTVTKNSKYSTFLPFVISILNEYYEKDVLEYDKDLWHVENLPIKVISNTRKILNFSSIKQPIMKKQLKEYCYHKLSSINSATVYSQLKKIEVFCIWLYKYDSTITYFDMVDRTIMEKYFIWLRTESGLSQNNINMCILYLKKFLDDGIFFDFNHFPTNTLIIENDYFFKTKKDSKYYTDEEMKNIVSVINKMPKQIGRFVYCLLMTGMRSSDLRYLKPDDLIINDNGDYSLKIHQVKTKKVHMIAINKDVAKMLLYEIKISQQKFGQNVKYIFAGSIETPIHYHNISRVVNKIFYENNVLNRDGEKLRFTTHRIRSTVATKLLNSGYSSQIVAQLLGHSNLESLTHYVTLSNNTVQEQLAPRIAKDQILIENIGKMENIEVSQPEQSITLCNGWCCKDSRTGICKKANQCLFCTSFITSKQYLNNYCLQLQETEATIEVAKANNYDVLLNTSLKTKEALEKIIQRIKE